MTMYTLSELVREAHVPSDLTTGRAKLLFLADFLEKLPVGALRMDTWVSDFEADDPDRLSRERAMQLAGVTNLNAIDGEDELGDTTIPFTPDPIVHASCGFAACAVGWAGSCKEFVELGLHMVLGEEHGEVVAFPVFQEWTGLRAVEYFFDISSHAVQFLFTPHGYDEEVTPQEVATKIREFVTCEVDN